MIYDMESNTDKKSFFSRFTSAQIIPAGFLMLILIGTVLLMLPFSTAEGEVTSPLTALFTSTTSVCVTGLVVTDTFDEGDQGNICSRTYGNRILYDPVRS